MPARHSYWVIVSSSMLTAFRSRQKEDLLPTLRQLQRTQPDADLRWFERGRVWRSPEEARDAAKSRGTRPPGRGRDWRPGGAHRDPRAKYQLTRDQKRARFKKNNAGRPNKFGPKTKRKRDDEV